MILTQWLDAFFNRLGLWPHKSPNRKNWYRFSKRSSSQIAHFDCSAVQSLESRITPAPVVLVITYADNAPVAIAGSNFTITGALTVELDGVPFTSGNLSQATRDALTQIQIRPDPATPNATASSIDLRAVITTAFTSLSIVSIQGGPAADNIVGSDFADQINAGNGNNYVSSGAENDTVTTGSGNDTVFGGNGNDSLTDFDPNINATSRANSLDGGDGNDTLTANSGTNTLLGGNGSDSIDGGANKDSIQGGAGNDTENGNAGTDSIFGEDGNDSLTGGRQSDLIEGGLGDDTIVGDLLATNTAGEPDTLIGGLGNDNLFGGPGDDQLNGDAGNDVLRGGNGNDILSGNEGNDRLIGDAGNDILLGGLGDDTLGRRTFGITGTTAPTLTFAAASGNTAATITRSAGNFISDGFLPGQSFTIANTSFNNIQAVTISSLTDTVLKLVGSLILAESTSSASLTTTETNDESGQDILVGGYGADAIDGGSQGDVLTGGIVDSSVLNSIQTNWLNGGTYDSRTMALKNLLVSVGSDANLFNDFARDTFMDVDVGPTAPIDGDYNFYVLTDERVSDTLATTLSASIAAGSVQISLPKIYGSIPTPFWIKIESERVKVTQLDANGIASISSLGHPKDSVILLATPEATLSQAMLASASDTLLTASASDNLDIFSLISIPANGFRIRIGTGIGTESMRKAQKGSGLNGTADCVA